MKVQLAAATTPLIRTEDNTRYLTLEEFIVYCARVSNPSNQLNTSTASNLIKYCINHEHWSIFEQCFVALEIQTSRDISAQIIRHKSFTFQEFSQRYSKVTSLESFDVRKQATNNRQSSTELLEMSPDEMDEIKSHLYKSLELYDKWVSKGAAKECMRKILPMCSQTTLYMSGSIRSWIHYIKIRTKTDTQLEHALIAKAAEGILSQIVPTVAEVLNWNASNKVD
jgi:thymidylate synthase (FAD)